MATMGLSRTVSDINGDFGRKWQIFPLPCNLAPAEGVPLGSLEVGVSTGGRKKLE